MGEVVKFPGVTIKGKTLNYVGNPIVSIVPEADTAIIEVEDEMVQDNDDFNEDEYVVRLVEAKTPQAFLDILKEFLDPDEYKDVLLAIMDREYLEELEEETLVFVEGYFHLMGFDPNDDPRVA